MIEINLCDKLNKEKGNNYRPLYAIRDGVLIIGNSGDYDCDFMDIVSYSNIAIYDKNSGKLSKLVNNQQISHILFCSDRNSYVWINICKNSDITQIKIEIYEVTPPLFDKPTLICELTPENQKWGIKEIFSRLQFFYLNNGIFLLMLDNPPITCKSYNHLSKENEYCAILVNVNLKKHKTKSVSSWLQTQIKSIEFVNYEKENYLVFFLKQLESGHRKVMGQQNFLGKYSRGVNEYVKICKYQDFIDDFGSLSDEKSFFFYCQDIKGTINSFNVYKATVSFITYDFQSEMFYKNQFLFDTTEFFSEEIGKDYTDIITLNGKIYSMAYNSNKNTLNLFDMILEEKLIRLPLSELFNIVVFSNRYFVFEDNNTSESIVFDIMKRKIIYKFCNYSVAVLGNHVITY
jgi:hypothetical protein